MDEYGGIWCTKGTVLDRDSMALTEKGFKKGPLSSAKLYVQATLS